MPHAECIAIVFVALSSRSVEAEMPETLSILSGICHSHDPPCHEGGKPRIDALSKGR